jgi:thiol:disulfide interchange protein DsbD
VTLAVFTSVGLGMASPYLLIGAFPSLIRFLPRPGAWMDTFKQVMGFVLLGTVVYLFTFLETSYLVPTLGLLFALWLACWWVARTPVGASGGTKVRAWLEAAAMVGAAWVLLFAGLQSVVPERVTKLRFRGLHEIMAGRLEQRVGHEVGLRFAQSKQGGAAGEGEPALRAPRSEHELPWQPFTTRTEFETLLASGKTVLVDFTADWCATCKTLEAWYMNTREVRELVQANGVITVKADWTDYDPEITAVLELLGARQVPVIAIFPAGDPNNPIRFLNGYTRAAILEALKKAGPSKPKLVSSAARR